MAERRMFAKTIIDSDAFLDMPLSTQALYFHLSMRADDDGFINNPRKIQRIINCSDDDFKVLLGKKFVIPFESGVCVIKHWLIHNYIRNDRYKETVYTDEKSQLNVKENKAYTLNNNLGIPNGYHLETQVRLGKVRLGKDSIDIDIVEEEENNPPPPKEEVVKVVKHKYGEYKHILLSDEDYKALTDDYLESIILTYIKKIDEYVELKGKGYRNYRLAIRQWLDRDKVQKKGATNGPNSGNTKSEDRSGIGLKF